MMNSSYVHKISTVAGPSNDSLSGQRLLAAVDKWLGSKTLRGAFGKWTNVEKTFDYWAERMRTRLAE